MHVSYAYCCMSANETVNIRTPRGNRRWILPASEANYNNTSTEHSEVLNTQKKLPLLSFEPLAGSKGFAAAAPCQRTCRLFVAEQTYEEPRTYMSGRGGGGPAGHDRNNTADTRIRGSGHMSTYQKHTTQPYLGSEQVTHHSLLEP